MMKMNKIDIVKETINKLINENETSRQIGKFIYKQNTLKLLRLKNKIIDEILGDLNYLREFIRITTIFSTLDLLETGRELTKNYFYTLHNIIDEDMVPLIFPNNSEFPDEVNETEFIIIFLINIFYSENKKSNERK